MPRTARIHLPDGLFHIISRAIDRRFLFDGLAERRRYVELLGAASKHSDARVLAWCIMSNHVHLVVQAGKQPLSRLMKSVHVGYANWKNHRDGRIGPIFSERCKAVLVDADEYLLELVRYVHLNPVRAGLVASPRESSWSSHRTYVGLAPSPAWLHTSALLGLFGDDAKEARQAFDDFVEDGIGGARSPLLCGDEAAEVAQSLAAGFGKGHRPSDGIVGSEAFVEAVMEKLEEHVAMAGIRRRETVARTRPPIERLADLCCEVIGADRDVFDAKPKARASRFARYMLIRVWVSVYRGRQVDVARALRVSPEQVSRWFSRSFDYTDELLKPYEELLNKLDRLEAEVAAERALVERVVPHEDPKVDARVSVNLRIVED